MIYFITTSICRILQISVVSSWTFEVIKSEEIHSGMIPFTIAMFLIVLAGEGIIRTLEDFRRLEEEVNRLVKKR